MAASQVEQGGQRQHAGPADQLSPSSTLRLNLSRFGGTLREKPGYIASAVGGISTLLLLFQPWVTASGPNGEAQTNAFGHIEATSKFLTAFSQHPPTMPYISGVWALLSSASIIITVSTVVLNVKLRMEIIARVSAIMAVVTTVLVFATLIYLNTKAPHLRAMTLRTTDFGGWVGTLLSWASGTGNLPVPGFTKQGTASSAGLTLWAMLAAAVSLVSAIAAVGQWIRDYVNPAVFKVIWHRSPVKRHQ